MTMSLKEDKRLAKRALTRLTWVGDNKVESVNRRWTPGDGDFIEKL